MPNIGELIKVKVRQLLKIKDFSLGFKNKKDFVKIFNNVNLAIREGQIVGLLGNSGCGKSVIAKSIFNAWHNEMVVTQGQISFFDLDQEKILLPAKKGAHHQIYGSQIAMVFQEPSLAFNPVFTCYNQIFEVAKKHLLLSDQEIAIEIAALAKKLGLEKCDFESAYPHEISGGQLQRLMILMAIITKPKLLVADEPTTSLDTISQKQVLEIFKHLNSTNGTSILIVTHDYKVMKYLNAETYLVKNKSIERKESFDGTEDLITFENEISLEKTNAIKLEKTSFSYNKEPVLNNIELELKTNEVLGVVGPSGCGKSTLAKLLVGLIADKPALEPKYSMGEIQIIFQHPGAALDPSQKAFSAITEALWVKGLKPKSQRKEKAQSLLKQVGLDEAHFDKFPHQLSGGQKQRLCIARALASKPKILICDEAVSSLDEALKEKIINLLLGLRKQYGLSIIFISHDISIVEKISQRIIVMDNGEIAELGTPDELLANPKSDTLKKLIESSL